MVMQVSQGWNRSGGGLVTELPIEFHQADPRLPKPPVDAVITDEDSDLAGIDVITLSDTDPDLDPLTIVSVTQGDLGGSVTIDPGALTITYDPNGQFEYLAVGEQAFDTFRYTISDGRGGFSTAEVAVTIDGVNDEPTAVDDDGWITVDVPPAAPVRSLRETLLAHARGEAVD